MDMHRVHRFVYHAAHKGESVLHVCYLLGVAAGSGYRYVAIGLVVCICLVAALRAGVEE